MEIAGGNMAKSSTKTTLPKITPPRSARLYLRRRLFDLIDEHRKHHSLIWVQAPAGAGKTSLATSYLNTRKLPALWYQIDKGDVDIASFFFYMGLAVAPFSAENTQAMPLLKAEYLGDLATFTRNFFRELHHRLPGNCLIIIDNYQILPSDSPLHELLSTIVQEVRQGQTILVLSRERPPTALARQRVNNDIALISSNQLQLTADETQGVTDTRLGDEQPEAPILVRLHERAQGWVAGLVLLLEQMGVESALTPDSVPATQGLLFDYFAGEVFSQFTTAQQNFLLKTSLFNKILIPAAGELTGNANAAEILEELATRNYFTVQHADSFEYHPLFRDFLLNRLSTQIEPDKLSNLQQKAAQLLFDYGMIEDAIEVLLVAGAWQTLIPMLLQQAATLTNQGRAQALQRWIGAIPIKAREQEPWLYYWLGISNIASNTAEARTNLQRAHVSFTSCQDRSGMLLAWAGIVETLILEFDDLSRLETWISWLDEDLRQRPEFPTPAIELRVVASMTVAKLFCREDDAEIQPWIEKAEASLELIPDLSARCRLTTYLALHATWKGDIGRLAMLTDWIKQWSEILSANDREGIDVQYALYCRTLYEWAAGIDRFGCDAGTLALSHVARSGIHVLEHHLLARCLTAYLCLGNLVNARKLLHQLHTLTVHGNARPRMHVFQYHNLPGWISLLEGHYQQALYEAQESLEISQTKGATVFHRASSHLVAGHALALTQHMAEAQVHVEQAMSLAKTFGSTLMEYSALLLQAYVKGEGEDNSSYLQSAFALGRQYTYLNTLVWVPELMAELCCRALANNIETDYVRTFITTRHIEPAQPPLHLENWPWPLRIYTLGRFSIHSGGRNLVSTLGKGHKKPLELIQTLIALGGRQVGVAHLIEQLWPDAEGDAAMNLFKITLHRLRKLLSYEDTIEFAEGRLSLNPKKVWVDCWALSRILAEKHGDDAVNRVLDLYHGHFLALEPANNSALVSFRDQLRGRVLKTLKSQIQRAEKQDDWKKVIDYSARGLELDDLDEDFYGALIRAYLAKGRQAEALRVLERAEVRYALLNVNPSAQLQALFSNR